jgi:two-component system, OmpR family, sensor histidine kinase VicK
MKTVELRHLDEVKGNFGIGDSKIYQASAKDFVEQQQYFFDML